MKLRTGFQVQVDWHGEGKWTDDGDEHLSASSAAKHARSIFDGWDCAETQTRIIRRTETFVTLFTQDQPTKIVVDAFAERQALLCTGCRLRLTECRCYVEDES